MPSKKSGNFFFIMVIASIALFGVAWSQMNTFSQSPQTDESKSSTVQILGDGEQSPTIELVPSGQKPTAGKSVATIPTGDSDSTPSTNSPKPPDTHKASASNEPNSQEAAAASSSPIDDKAIITLDVTGLKSKSGDLRVAVFYQKDGFPDHTKAMYTVEFPLSDTESFTLKPIAKGSYSFAVYHDKNSDDKMNKGTFGIPTEVYGFSNKARSTFGPPSFEAALVKVETGEQELPIHLK